MHIHMGTETVPCSSGHTPWVQLAARPTDHLEGDCSPRAGCRPSGFQGSKVPTCPHHPSHLIGAVASWEAHFQAPPPSPLPPWPGVTPPSSRCQQAVLLLHFRVLHLCNGVCGFHLLLLQVLRPHVVHPVHQVYLKARPLSALAGLPNHLNPFLLSLAFPPPSPRPAVGVGRGQDVEGVREGTTARGLPTTVGRLTRCSSLVWLNSRLMTLYSLSRSASGVS